MFTHLKIKNFQSLINLEVDFMKTNTSVKNMIVIYGENGAGKTNFARVFYMLTESLRTMAIRDALSRMLEQSKEDLSKMPEDFLDFVKSYYSDTEKIIKKYKTIDSKDNMSVELHFQIKGSRGTYYIEYNDLEIVSEKLDYVLNKNLINFYEISKNKFKINEKIFSNRDYYNQFINELKKYWGKHSFMSILSYEFDDKKKSYMNKNVSKNLHELLNYFMDINTKIKEKDIEFGVFGTRNIILKNMYSGTISLKDEKNLDKTANMLNLFFTSLYSDIKQVFYKKEIVSDKIKYKLHSKKLIYGKLIDIDFEVESTGTQKLLSFIPYLILALQGKVVIIDELDSGIHDILLTNLLKNIKQYLKGQLIITTHNTMLLESALTRNEVYILSVNHNAEKELIPLSEFEERDHQNLNKRKRYINGLYGGVPFTSDIDFDNIVNYLKD